ncbi:hypothetical protein ACJ41O_013564 [Fusarium nematophilum]
MDSSINWVVPRAEDGGDSYFDVNKSGFQFEPNSTSAWDNELKLAAAGSVRTSIVVLACFNILAAFATAVGIFWDSWKDAKRTFFITPYIQLIFGLELTIRLFKPSIFPARGKWNVLICLAVIGLFLLLTFVITFAILPPNFCFAGLFWYLHRYTVGCFGLLITIILLLLMQCAAISFKLHTGAKMCAAERDQASRMVYYMVIALLSYTLVITFFYNTSFQDPPSASPVTMQLAMVASVVANLSGILTGCLYLFLRSSSSRISPCEDIDIEVTKGFKKNRDSQDPEPSTPNSIVPRPLRLPKHVRKTESKDALISDARDEGKVIGARQDILHGGFPRPLRLASMCLSQKLPSKPEPARTTSKPSLKNFKKSMYSIFPKDEGPKSPLLLPTTTYTPPSKKKAPETDLAAVLLAPPAIHDPEEAPRRRGSSIVSTATVQIGLRLSNIDDVGPPKTSSEEDLDHVHNLDCPNSTVTFFPRKTSPLAIAIVDVPGEGTTFKLQDNFDKENLDKELPPVPLGESSSIEDDDDKMTLSSAVYSPQSQRTGPFSQQLDLKVAPKDKCFERNITISYKSV